MQSASAPLAAALTSQERSPVLRVKADWARDGSYAYDPGVFVDVFSDTFESAGDIGDLSPFVESVSVDRSLTTDLPDAARLDSGYGAAQATAQLSGTLDGGIDLIQALSAYSDVSTRRLGTPVFVELGASGSNGPEYLRQFTGKARSLGSNPMDSSVSLAALDGRERLRTPTTFPVAVADDRGAKRPGLNAQWFIDQIARANGIYVSPPTRANCILSATMHGSAIPDVAAVSGAGGIFQAFSGATGSNLFFPSIFVPHSDGLLGLGRTGALNCYAEYYLGPGLSVNQGATAFFEVARLRLNGFSAAVIGDAWDPSNTASFNVFATAGTPGNVQVRVRRGGVDSPLVTLPLSSLTVGVDHYVAVSLTMTSTGFTVQARCDGVTASATGTVGNPTGNADMATALYAVTNDFIISGVQITTEPYSAGMFNHNFAATAVYETSLNELTATPSTDTSDPWSLLQQIAAAEQGIVLFDENDVLRFYNRDHMSGGSPVATVTTDPATFANLKSIASEESIDSIRNYVTVGAVPLALDSLTPVWTLSELIGVPAGGTIRLPAEFPGPIYNLSSVSYLAAQQVDGSGGDVTNLQITWTGVTTTSYNLFIYNPNPFDVFLVGNSTTPGEEGQPKLAVIGQCVRPALESGYTSIAQDDGSIASWGYQPLDVPANVWRQSSGAADGLAWFLLGALKDPHPTLSGVEIVGDPRLQLADRVRVTEPDGLALDGEFWLVGCQTTFSSGGLTQSVTLRQA